MKTYQTFASTLEALLAGNEAVRIHVDGYMPLVVEAIGHSGDGGQLVALSHTTVQNGDLMDSATRSREHGGPWWDAGKPGISSARRPRQSLRSPRPNNREFRS